MACAPTKAATVAPVASIMRNVLRWLVLIRVDSILAGWDTFARLLTGCVVLSVMVFLRSFSGGSARL